MGEMQVEAPMQGTIVSVSVAEGDAVHTGMPVLVIEAMKMEHVITAEVAGVVRTISAVVGATVYPGDVLVEVEEGSAGALTTHRRAGSRERTATPSVVVQTPRLGAGARLAGGFVGAGSLGLMAWRSGGVDLRHSPSGGWRGWGERVGRRVGGW